MGSYAIILLLTLLASLASSAAANDQNDLTTADFVFDLPDIVATHETPWGEVQLEAFGSRKNSAILNNDNKTSRMEQQSLLYWVSIGHPELLSMPNESEYEDDSIQNTTDRAVFHFVPDGVHAYIQMLTSPQRILLAKTAAVKYGLEIRPDQIAHLVLDKFECKLFLQNGPDRKHLIKGSVIDFRAHPLRMDFEVPEGSPERTELKRRLNTKGRRRANLRFICDIASVGKVVRVNTLSISSREFQELGVVEKLLGPANSTCVTRQQLNMLAVSMYSSLNIVEEYEMPELEFQTAFVDEMIRHASVGHFTQVPFVQALKELSSYGLDVGKDIQPDEIFNEMGSILEVKKESGKERIVINNDFLNAINTQGKFGAGAGGGLLGFLRLLELNFFINTAIDWNSSSKSINDQLKELNEEHSKDVGWTIEGSRVIPKSLKVARVTASSLSRSMTFTRVRRKHTEAPFNRRTALYLLRSPPPANVLENVESMLFKLEDLQNANRINIMQTKTDLSNAKLMLKSVTEMSSKHASKIKDLENGLSALNVSAVRECRICSCIYVDSYNTTQTQMLALSVCKNSSGFNKERVFCSGWSKTPSFSQEVSWNAWKYDYYQFMLECRAN